MDERVEPPAGGEELPRKVAMARRATAYAFFVLAGWVVVSAAWILLESYPAYVRAITQPWEMAFWMLLLPGVAAGMGAAAGVLAAHAAYAALVFAVALGHEALLRDASPLAPRVLAEAGDYALVAGVVSLILGFLPNVLVAEGFAGFMLGRHPASARPGAAHPSLAKGAGHASSVLAE